MPQRIEYNGQDLTAGISELTISDEELQGYKDRFDQGVGRATYSYTLPDAMIKPSIKKDRSSMKEKVLVTLAIILAVGGLGYAGIHHHNQDVYHQEQAEAQAENQAIAKAKAEQAAQAKAAALAAQQAAAKAAAAKPIVKTTIVK